MINIIKISIFGTLMIGFIVGTTIREKRANKPKTEKVNKKLNESKLLQ